MASSSPSDDQRKTESGSHPIPDTNHPPDRPPERQPAPTQYPSPVPGYPPMMGYPPPPMGYNQHPPPPYYHNYGGYPPPPPAAYYTTQPHQIGSCARCFLLGLILFVLITFLSSLITWLVFRPVIPSFQLEQFSVSNFNTNGTFTANWDASVTVENRNQKLKVYFDRIRTIIYYNEHYVSMAAVVDPFSLDIKAKTNLATKLATNNSEQAVVESSVVREMAHDRSSGTVKFNLRIDLWSTFKSDSWWTRHVYMSVYCEDLGVGFSGNANNGTLIGEKPRVCSVGG